MAKIKKNFFLPRELVEWMSSQEHGGMIKTPDFSWVTFSANGGTQTLGPRFTKPLL